MSLDLPRRLGWPAPTTGRSEVKVRLHQRQLARMHWLRMKEGMSFSATVEAALDAYFDRH